ncbi:hypothetical protein [Azospirillum largimobile]
MWAWGRTPRSFGAGMDGAGELARRIPPLGAAVESRAKGTESVVSQWPAVVSHRPATVSPSVADMSPLVAFALRIGFDPVCPRFARGRRQPRRDGLSRLPAVGALACGPDRGLLPRKKAAGQPRRPDLSHLPAFRRPAGDPRGSQGFSCVANARGWEPSVVGTVPFARASSLRGGMRRSRVSVPFARVSPNRPCDSQRTARPDARRAAPSGGPGAKCGQTGHSCGHFLHKRGQTGHRAADGLRPAGCHRPTAPPIVAFGEEG